MDPQISKSILEGQEIIINRTSKVVILELREIFNHAGSIFEWDPKFGSQAFGVNRSILRLIELTKSKLLINYKSQETKKEYWINHDKLKQFILKNKCEFRVGKGSKLLCNIPLVLFKSKPIFSRDP